MRQVEQEAERPDLIARLRQLAEYWRGHDQECWVPEVADLWKAIHRSMGTEWCEILVERGRETDLEMGWPETGCKVGEPYWELDQWCSLMVGLFRNRPNLVADPLDCVAEVLRFFSPTIIAPLDLDLTLETDEGWNKWREANVTACETIADMLTNQPDDAAVADADRFELAAWFESEAGIQSAMLRKAASQNRKSMKVRKTGEGKGTRYSVRDAKANWPDRFAEIRRKREAPR